MVVTSAMSKKRSLVQFGREVKRRRETMGLTLERFAERAGLTSNYIGTIENGHRDPSISSILAIARGLNVPPGELFGEAPELTQTAVQIGKLFDTAAYDIRLAILMILRALNTLLPGEPKPVKPVKSPKPVKPRDDANETRGPSAPPEWPSNSPVG
jgi:transcriptional regulator with XRE-family HTH domain